jgi:peptide-methionine (S)-S-oxide reductase
MDRLFLYHAFNITKRQALSVGMKIVNSFIGLFLLSGSLLACQPSGSSQAPDSNISNTTEAESVTDQPNYLQPSKKQSVAVFAGGCFWCTEASFERIMGVDKVISGYAGGKEENPTYEQVSYGRTSHAESIMVYYDSTEIMYRKLVEIFFDAHDPTQLNRQGPDVGKQYRSAIFYQYPYQKEVVEEVIDEIGRKFTKPIVTELSKFTNFYPAEEYHQDYYELHPNDSYIVQVSRPKVEKVEKIYADILKDKYKK